MSINANIFDCLNSPSFSLDTVSDTSDGDTTNMAQLDPAAARRLTEAITRVDEEINGPGAF